MSNSNARWGDVDHLYSRAGLNVLFAARLPLKEYNSYADCEYQISATAYYGGEKDPMLKHTPILRPLASITQEEAREYVSDFGIPFHNPTVNKVEITNLHKTTSIYFSWEAGRNFGGNLVEISGPLTPIAMLYLLNKGFDLFNLIESGEALDATKIGGGE